MNHAIIIHGWGADSSSNWFPWLKKELEKKDLKVDVPDFPNTQNPQLSEWFDYFEENVFIKNPADTVLIGHSLGVPFILRYLEKFGVAPSRAARSTSAATPVKTSYFIAGFHKPLGYSATESFVNKPFDWDKIKSACKKFTVINSDNDPYIPRTVGQELAFNLGVDEIVEHNAGHLNAPGGFLEFPRLLSLITF